MLGFSEFWAFMGYLCTILSAVLCVAYGVARWNSPKTDQAEEVDEEIK
ncbi:MAG: symporter small accessory protein [Endomicrobiales bacterium]